MTWTKCWILLTFLAWRINLCLTLWMHLRVNWIYWKFPGDWKLGHKSMAGNRGHEAIAGQLTLTRRRWLFVAIEKQRGCFNEGKSHHCEGIPFLRFYCLPISPFFQFFQFLHFLASHLCFFQKHVAIFDCNDWTKKQSKENVGWGVVSHRIRSWSLHWANQGVRCHWCSSGRIVVTFSRQLRTP